MILRRENGKFVPPVRIISSGLFQVVFPKMEANLEQSCPHESLDGPNRLVVFAMAGRMAFGRVLYASWEKITRTRSLVPASACSRTKNQDEEDGADGNEMVPK